MFDNTRIEIATKVNTKVRRQVGLAKFLSHKCDKNSAITALSIASRIPRLKAIQQNIQLRYS